MSSTPMFPSPDRENIFLPDAIEFNIKNNAEQPFYTFSDPAAPDGIRVITHLEFGRAAHRMAHALRPARSGPDGQVVAIVALSDIILYQAIVVGCIIAGLVPFPISPRNSPAALANLLESTSCYRILTTQRTLKPVIDQLCAQIAAKPFSNALQIEEVPSLAATYPFLGYESVNDPFENYPRAEQGFLMDDICLYIHSAGSTGFPKAVPQTHRAMIHWSHFPVIVDARDYRPRMVMSCMAPPTFHAIGVTSQIMMPIFGIVAISVYPPTATAPDLLPMLPSPQNILEHTKLTKSSALAVIPTLLQIWSQSPDDVKFLSALSYVGYIGGSLAPRLGDILVNSGVRLYPLYGTTEFGPITRLMSCPEDPKNWEYIRFDDYIKVRWASQGDGTFECQILSSGEHKPMVLNLPDVEGYASSDLFVPHPTKKDLWKIVGRLDDVIVHSSGEKTVPAPMENIVLSSPIVQAAIIFGRERNQTGILIEPKADNHINVTDQAELALQRNRLWPIIEEANKIAPAFSRIFKEMIIVTPAGKPLPRTGKGTVMRKAALHIYSKEIEELYNNIEAARINVVLESLTFDDIRAWLVRQATDLIAGDDVSRHVDLFRQGFDSLSATFLRLRIVGAFRSSKDSSVQTAAQDLSQNLVYSYPVIDDLAAHLVFLLSHQLGDLRSDAVGLRIAQIEEMITKYSFQLEDSPIRTRSLRTDPAIVLLTGSTGNLGAEILSALLRDSRVEHIYAFNRPSQTSVQERQIDKFEKRGLPSNLLDTKRLSFISSDASKPNLGLDSGQYDQLRKSVNIIIHNAWKVDFNLSLSAFETNIQGTRRLIDLLESGSNASNARLLFSSSISCAQSWPESRGPYPEEIVDDASFAVGTGYGEGKYVAERILAKCGLQTTSLRIGQISGGQSKGAWSVTEWLPILVKSSVAIGSFPDIKGVVSWIPIDVVASAIVEAALSSGTLSQAINIVHTQPVKAADVFKYLQTAITETLGLHLQNVSFSEWVSNIEQRAKDPTQKTLENIPAIKLLDFFRSMFSANDEISLSSDQGREAGGLPRMETHVILRVSKDAMSNLQPIGSEDVALWVKYWREVHFFN